MITIISVSAVKTEKDGAARTDRKQNRQFLTVIGADKSNPFDVRSYTRNIFQRYLADETPSWGATSPEALKATEGKSFPGVIVKTEKVQPFTFTAKDSEGKDVKRTADRYTCMLFPHESSSEAAIAAAFRSMGHPLASEVAARVISEEAPVLEAPVLEAPADLRKATV